MDTNGNYIKKQFCNYEIALKLKELGFDKECLASYYTDDERNYSKNGEYDVRKKLSSSIDFDPFKNDFDNFYKNSDKDYYVAAPLWQQVIDWFREKYDVNIHVYKSVYGGYGFRIKETDSYLYFSYEEAREQAILKAIDLCKNN